MTGQATILAGLVRGNPWRVLQWKSCQKEKEYLASQFVSWIDDALFERDRELVFELSHILLGFSKNIDPKSSHVSCKAQLCLGSAFSTVNEFDLAWKKIKNAEALAGTCADCLGNVEKRKGYLSLYQSLFGDSIKSFDQALAHFEGLSDDMEICSTLLCRSATCRYVQKYAEGPRNIERALSLMTAKMPSRFFVTAAVNSISLSAASNDQTHFRFALELIEELRVILKEIRLHSRVRGVLRWVRGLLYDKLGDQRNSIRCVESAVDTFERLGMKEEKRVAMADLARLRRKGKQRETNDRHIKRLIDETLRFELDPKTRDLVRRASHAPTEENILEWRNSLSCYVPSLEPEPEELAIC